jgi:plastocyanin
VIGAVAIHQLLLTPTLIASNPNKTSDVYLDFYAGEYGFGYGGTSITSPGPTLTFKTGQTVTATLHNVGALYHTWAIVTEKRDGNTNLAFANAQVASPQNAVSPGGTKSATFTVGSTGSYYYICQNAGHVSMGMWGNVIVTP